MLIKSNQLVGAGSENIPMKITPGTKLYQSNFRVFMNTTLISRTFRIEEGEATKLETPPDRFLLRGTGILHVGVFYLVVQAI